MHTFSSHMLLRSYLLTFLSLLVDTRAMLVKLWRAKPDADTTLPCVQANPPAKDKLSMDDCERIIMALLVEQVFTFYVHWTAYQAVPYLRVGQRGLALLQSTQPTILVRFPKKLQSTKETAALAELAARKAVPTNGEWLQVKPRAKRKKPSSVVAATAASKKKKTAIKAKPRAKTMTQKKSKATTTTAAATKKKSLQQQALLEKNNTSEVIELLSDDDDDNDVADDEIGDDDDDTRENDHQLQSELLDIDDDLVSPTKKKAHGSSAITLAAVAAAAASATAKSDDVLWDDDDSRASSEFEFTE
jgi:hypothetical protein